MVEFWFFVGDTGNSDDLRREDGNDYAQNSKRRIKYAVEWLNFSFSRRGDSLCPCLQSVIMNLSLDYIGHTKDKDYRTLPMPIEIASDQEIWVLTGEGAEVTGYSQEYLEKMANKNWRLPEDERLIKTRKRRGRYELWLPDLLRYIKEIGTGPMNSLKK